MPQKPEKPSDDFPLTPHPNGQWCKKINKTVYFFGVWDNPEAARRKYLDEKEDLQAGRGRRLSKKGMATTDDMVNGFLTRCLKRVRNNELSAVSFADYKLIGSAIIDHFGRNTCPELFGPPEFASFKDSISRYSPSRKSKIVAVTRMIVKWAFDSDLLTLMPKFGPDFSVVGNKAKRIFKAQQDPKLLEPAEILGLLSAADPQWNAILLLCINGGLGNSDIARVKKSNINADWLELPRIKTGIYRRIPLWKETVLAIRQIERLPEQELFVSKSGKPLIRVRPNGKRTDLTIEGFRRIAKKAGVHRPRMGLYWLRHTFQTIGDEAMDPVATSAIMGHIDGTMAESYREMISEKRLRRVTGCVHKWLFGAQK